MKKIIFLLGIFLTFAIVACKPEEEVSYDGDSYVHFQAESQNVFAVAGTPYTDAKIDYGTVQPVSGNHQVKLVLDKTKSTAVEGVDFQILNNNTSEIAAGAANGQFTVRVMSAQMSQTPKIAVFKIESPTIASAVFSKELTVNMSLTCPVSFFVGTGTFKNTEAYWSTVGKTYTLQNVTTGGVNQFVIKGYMDDGGDLKVNYNPTTFAVTIPVQSTGYFEPGYGYAYASDPSSGPASTYNPCTRTLSLKVWWSIRNTAGTVIAQYNASATEVFVGQ